ncbi:hypothetical protein SAMD00019534_010360 [Acytostelium subglobosum LB1]|uniref:hypothetical protein n=1 Tax=Acytostelium subglobosum LB1 TaxID=1410327 RepID=UPI00064490E4|nr:hypothetical protein SAMD00019534_010360 [Acytostelium subglobosum LB1]GAM17861.1 hypothetical protein SAMD00019534_010360 [Acytostelium subglobosum LB1]|eukprot:XP_012758457.1 hypothetical protein SAMD00019534_010360 [Acytostelium subglobosum LB1]
MKFEQLLGREVNSPYRQPFTQFLAKYPAKAVDIFITQAWTIPQMATLLPQYATTFRLIVKAGEVSKPIVEELAKNYSVWLDMTQMNPDFTYLGLSIVNTIIKNDPKWLIERRPVLDKLLEIWRSPTRQDILRNNGEISSPTILKETRIIIKCFIHCCRQNYASTELLFQMLFAFLIRGPIDFSFLRDYLQGELMETTTVAQKQDILREYLEFMQTAGPELKVHAIQNIVIPLLNSYFQLDAAQRTIQPELFGQLAKQTLESEIPNDEMLLVELLQLETLLIKNVPIFLIDTRRDLIKFAWNHFKNEDFTCRQTAYVLACRFIEAYETPVKIVLQVYVQLLKAFQNEAKHLVKQALDILVPALKVRLVDNFKNMWIKWTKKVIVEESHSLQQVVHILQLIVRHPTLFYPSRAQFISQMVSVLPKIGLVSNITPENKKLSIDIIEMIITWEKWRINPHLLPVTATATATAMATTGPAATSQPTPSTVPPVTPTTEVNVTTPSQQVATPITQQQADDDYRLPASVIEHILLFLIRLMTNGTDAKNTVLVDKCSDLVRQALSIWPDANIKFQVFERLLHSDQPLILSTTLNILNIIYEFQINTFVTTNVANIQAYVQVLQHDNPKISQLICAILRRTLQTFPTNGELAQFYTSMATAIDGILATFEKNFNISILNVLKTFKDEQPDWIEPYLPHLMKIIQRLTGFLLAPDTIPIMPLPPGTVPPAGAQPPRPPGAPPAQQGAVAVPGQPGLKPAPGAFPGAPNAAGAPAPQGIKRSEKEIAQALIKCYALVKAKIVKLTSDNRKIFLQSLLVLLEHSNDIELLSEVLAMTTSLITQKEYAGILMSKEKVNFVLKMSRFGQLDNKDLINSYFSLIQQVYSDPSSSRLELSQLEPGFMLGLRSHDPKTRRGLFEILHKSIGSTPFQRLNYIVSIQQWDALGNNYWIRHALDLLLAILPATGSVSLHNSMARFHHILPSTEGHSASAGASPPPGGVSSQFADMLASHDEWIEGVSSNKVTTGDIISALSELTFNDIQLCHHLWVLVFSAMWAKLSKEEHYKLSKSLTTLLTKDYKKTPNNAIQLSTPEANQIVQTLLEGVAKCTPAPKIPVEIISYLGDAYNAYYTSVKMLEVNLLEGSKTPEQTEPVWDALGTLYNNLNERDLLFGLLRRRYTCDETKLGLLLEQFYYWQSAQEVYFSAMNKYSSNGAKSTTKSENILWEDHWIDCAKRLNQWEVLLDYARQQNMNELLVESSWKLSAWTLMREALGKLQPHGDTSIRKILQGYSLIIDKKFTEVDPNIVNSNQLILKKWVSLPERAFHAHSQGLVEMQQVVELQEAVHLLKEVTFSISNLHTAPLSRPVLVNTINDVKTIFTIWRERLPSKDEDSGVWNDLLTWRQQVFSLLGFGVEQISEYINAGQNQPVKPIVLPETSWTTNKFAHITRKHHIIEVCLNSLSKMFNMHIEVQDIFLNLKEQIKCYLQLPTHYETGISIINGTNLDYFLPLQKSEFFQLKGEFQSRLGQVSDANLNFSTAIQLFDNYAKSWINWGYFCDSMFSNGGGSATGGQPMDAETKAGWAESAINCYIQGIRCDPRYGSKLIPRFLWLLYLNGSGEVPHTLPTMPQNAAAGANPAAPAAPAPAPAAPGTTPTEGTNPAPATTPEANPGTPTAAPQKKPSLAQSVFSSIEKPITVLPHWLWLSHIPTLITGASMSLQFPGYGFLCWQMLNKVCCLYPNYSYYHFRKLVGDMKQNPTNPLLLPTPGAQATPLPGPLKMAETLSVLLQPFHASLINEIDTMLVGFAQLTHTIPSVHHLTSSLNHILNEAFRVPLVSEDIPVSITDMLKQVQQHYFEEPLAGAPQVNHPPLHSLMVERYKQEFADDFGPMIGLQTSAMDTASDGKPTLSSLISKLITWVQRKHSTALCTTYTTIESITVANYFSHNSTIRLETLAPSLADLRPTLLEVPSLYRGVRDPSQENNVKVDRIGLTAQMVLNSNGMLCPRVTFYATNGRAYPFLIDIETPLFKPRQSLRKTERRTQLLCSINNLLNKYRETRRRGITFNQYPTMVPINNNLNLVQAIGGREMTPLISVWSSQVPEQELYSPLIHYRNKLLGSSSTAAETTPKEKAHKPTKLQAFREISKYMSDSLMTSYMMKNLTTYQEQYEFKLSFAAQWGLHSMISYVLFSKPGCQSPSDIYFSKSTGSVYFGKWATDNYCENAEFTENGVVPFRLTQNIRSYLNPVFIEGGYQSSLLATAMCISQTKDQLINLLSLYIFDEILCGHISEPIAKTQNNQHLHQEILERTLKVIKQMINTRINVITPPVQPDKTLFLTPIVKKVNELIQLSSNSSNISQMESVSYPWL